MDITLETICREIQTLKKIAVIEIKDNLTVSEAALYMGISEGKVYQIIAKKEVCYFKPNRKTNWIPKSECDKWIERGKVYSKEEIEIEAEKVLKRLRSKRGL